jgi:integrase
VRVASAQADPTARLRDLALLTLLSDCGLRSQEAADAQLRELDLAGVQLVVRSGKSGKLAACRSLRPRRFAQSPVVHAPTRSWRDASGS